MKALTKSKSFFSNRLFLSYLIVLILPLILLSLVYYRIKPVLKTKIAETNQHILYNYANHADDIIDRNVVNIPRIFSEDEISYIHSLRNADDIYEKYKLAYSNYSSRLNMYSDYITNYFIYFPDNNSIFALNRIDKPDVFFNSKYGNTSDFSDFKNNVLDQSNNNPKYVLFSTSQKESILFFCYPKADDETKEIKYNIVAEINTEKLRTDNSSSPYVYFTDNENNIISDNGILPCFTNLHIPESMKNLSTFSWKINGKEHIINRVKSKIFPLTYMMIVPSGVYWRDIASANSLFMFCIVLSITLGGIIIIFSINKENKPMMEIISLFYGDDIPNRINNTYKDVIKQIGNLLDENVEYMSKLSEQNQVLRNNILKDILTTSIINENNFEKNLELADIKWNKNNFAVISICPIDYSQITINEELEKKLLPSQKQLALFLLSAVLSENIKTNLDYDIFTVNNMEICIFNLDENEEYEFYDTIPLRLKEILEIVENKYNFSFIASISEISSGLNCLNDEYSKTMFGIEYASSNNLPVVCCKNLPKMNSHSNYYPLETEMQIINCMQINNYKKCFTIIEELALKMDLMDCPLDMVLLFSCNIINTFFTFQLPEKYEQKSKSILMDGLKKIIENHSSKSNMLMNTVHAVSKYLTYIKDNTFDDSMMRSKETHIEIKNFIEKNFNNPDLGVNMIAYNLEKNASYISKLFKDKYGCNISAYISGYRINAAKKLLETTDKTNSEIAAAIGYTSVRTFLRVFDKIEGTTPLQYRINKKKEQS